MTGFRAAAAIALFSLLTFSVAANAQGKHERGRRGLSVEGRGVVTAVPDLARIRVGVVTESETAKQALSDNASAMQKVQAALREAGIAETDIQTDSLQVTPRYRNRKLSSGANEAEISGYVVGHRMRVTLRQIEKVGLIVDALVDSGANQIDSIHFAVAEPDGLLDEARKLAMADARHRAEVLAEAGSARLGAVLRIEEGGAPGGPMPHAGRMSAMAASTPVAKGQLSFEVSVRVVYEIQP